MIVIWFALVCASEYFELMKNGKLGRPVPPERCVSEVCNRKNCYWRHGSYQRLVLDGGIAGAVTIERFKCKYCKATISMLPAFLVPKRWHSLRLIAEKCQRYATKETSYRREANGPCETPAASPSQIWRWLDLISKKAKSLLLDVQAEAVAMEVSEELLLAAEKANCPNAEKAKAAVKQAGLERLAKVVAFGRAFLGIEKGILNAFGTQRRKNVEMMQRIIAGQAAICGTPHMVAPVFS